MASAFRARVTGDDRAFAHPVPEAASPIEAALLYAEWAGGEGEIEVTVTDCETGAEQCFRIDLEEHAAAPC